MSYELLTINLDKTKDNMVYFIYSNKDIENGEEMPPVVKKGLIGKTLHKTLYIFSNNPIIFLPFTFFALIEIAGLIFLYLIPRMPLQTLFGPPIRTFWGERFLHYPYNFLLLPKLSFYSRLLLSIGIGSFLLGTAVALTNEIFNSKKKIRMGASLKCAAKKYIALFAYGLIINALFYSSEKAITFLLIKYFLSGHKSLLFLKAQVWLGPIAAGLSFITVLLVQSAFAYVIPELIIGNQKLLKAFTQSVRLCIKFFFPTTALVGLAMLSYIPILVLIANSSFLIHTFFPEAIFYTLLLGAVINSFVIDLPIAVSTTCLYLFYKEQPEQLKGNKK